MPTDETVRQLKDVNRNLLRIAKAFERANELAVEAHQKFSTVS